MPEPGVLRAPREVLFGAGIADATGELARRLSDRVLVVTDAVLAAGEAARRVLDSLRSQVPVRRSMTRCKKNSLMAGAHC